MIIKKAIILSAILAAGTTAFAQTSNIKKASTNVQEYEKFRTTGTPQLGLKFLETAKDAIDLAVVNDKTKESPEAWTYYSLIYSNLATDKKSAEDAKKADEGILLAKKYAGLAAKEYPNDVAAATQNIELNLIVGNESKIIAEIENQIAKDSGNKTLYYYLGLAQNAAGNPKESYDAYKKAIAIDPNYIDANLNAE